MSTQLNSIPFAAYTIHRTINGHYHIIGWHNQASALHFQKTHLPENQEDLGWLVSTKLRRETALTTIPIGYIQLLQPRCKKQSKPQVNVYVKP